MSLITPISGSIGGALIGLSAGILLLGNGDILGCSGIVSSLFVKPRKTTKNIYAEWKLLFVTVFLITSWIIGQIGLSERSLRIERQFVAQSSYLPILSSLGFCITGFLVGFGTRLGNGCPSCHGICGMARWSKRAFSAVGIFMSTGLLSASMSLPKYKSLGFLYTSAESIEDNYPNEWSTFCAGSLIAIFIGKTINLLVSSKKTGSERSSRNDIYSKGPIAVVSAITFSTGLFVSGMTKNHKLHCFLDVSLISKGYWDPTLVFVMGSGFVTSMISYQFVPGHGLFKNVKAIVCPLLQDDGKFNIPTSQIIDRQLVVGSATFGVGWGLSGLCPGSALFSVANGYPPVLFYWWPCNIAGAILAEYAKGYILVSSGPALTKI